MLRQEPANQSARVSLAELMRQSPGWESVSQLDSATQLTLNQPLPVAFPNIPAARTIDHEPLGFSGGAQAISGGGVGAQSTQRVLAQVQARAIGHIRDRLSRETDELASRFATAQNLQVEQGVDQARQQAVDKYNASLQSLLTPIAARRINLNVQIAALTIDARPSNPPTAPDDYWNNLLAKRQAALDSLPTPQTIAQRAALDQISAQVNAARSALQQSARAQTIAYRATLHQRDEQILTRQSAGFTREQTDLLAIAGQLSTQLDKPMASSASSIGSIPKAASGAIVEGQHGNKSGFTGADSTSATFAAQRTRLIAELMDSTRRSAAHAAAELHYNIVDWNSLHPDLHASALIAARMRADAFQGA